MQATKEAKGAGKPGLVTSHVWNTICQKEEVHAQEALEIGRTNDNPRFKFLARALMTVIKANPGHQIKGMFDETRARPRPNLKWRRRKHQA